VVKFDFSRSVLNLGQENLFPFFPCKRLEWRAMMFLGTSVLIFISSLYE